jgi:hypothetical protein
MENRIELLRDLFHKILTDIEAINDDNFDEKLGVLAESMQNAEKSRLFLLQEYKIEDLRKYDNEFYLATKQIQAKFDNIIREKREESDKISQKLNDLQNQKKLVNYIR